MWSCGHGPTDKNYCLGPLGLLRIAEIVSFYLKKQFIVLGKGFETLSFEDESYIC